VSSESNRTDYWRAQLDEFRSSPIAGKGAGSFETTWIRERGSLQPAANAHSLVIETAGDLGLIGLAALFILLGGIAACARSAWRADRRLMAGPAAGLIAFASHSAIDWDWQVPGLTLFALLLASVAIAASDRNAASPRTAPRILVGLLSVLAVIGLGWSLRGVEMQHRGDRIVDSASLLGWTEDRYSRAKSELESAARLNPWPGPRLVLANAALASGHDADALAQARSLTEANPDSWLAWGLLAKAAKRSDPVLARSALARAHELRPEAPVVSR
jgi:O-antigen ligase